MASPQLGLTRPGAARAMLVVVVLLLMGVACQTGQGGSSHPASAAAPPPKASAALVVAPVASSSAVADPGAAPGQLSSSACLPPEFPVRRVAQPSHDVAGIVELLQNSDTVLADFEREFGKVSKSTTHSNSYEVKHPLAGVERVVVGYRRVQNVEFLERAEVEFTKGKQPSVLELATELGVKAQVGKQATESSCMDALCPSVAFARAGKPRALLFYLDQKSQKVVLGSRNNGQLRVDHLFFFFPGNRCGTGAPRPAPTPLPDPAPGPQADLAKAVEAAGAELSRSDPSREGLEALLSPFGKPEIRANQNKQVTGVRVVLPDQPAIAPLCFPGFAYLRDPELVCHVHFTSHVYSREGPGDQRLYLKVNLREYSDRKPPSIFIIELMLRPKQWKEMIF